MGSAFFVRQITETERTRTQSQARHDAMHEAAQMGITVMKEWACRMVNSRESHIALHGTKIPESEKFRSISGAELAYPGDPTAPASEVIKCHCVLIPSVEMPKEKPKDRLKKGAKNDIIRINLQLFAEKDLSRQKTSSLKRGLASFEVQIAKHKEKIAHPEQFYPTWKQKSFAEKKGLVKHWEKEIKNFEESVRNRIEELKKRGEYHD